MITAEKKKKNKFLPDFEKQSIYSLRFDELQGWLKENGQQSFGQNRFTNGFMINV